MQHAASSHSPSHHRSVEMTRLLPVCPPEADELFQERFRELLSHYESSGDSSCLHQLGCLSRSIGDLPKARMYLLAERQQLGAGDYARLTANAYEMGCLANQRGQAEQSLLYLRASQRYAALAQDAAAGQRAGQLLSQLAPCLREPRFARMDTHLLVKGA